MRRFVFHSLTVVATDSGTQGTSDVVNVEFLLALPQGEFAGIADQDRFLTGTNVAFTLTASDPDSDVTTIQIFINDQLVCQTNGVSVSLLDCDFSTTTLGAGSHVLTALTIDADGQTNTVSAVNFSVLDESPQLRPIAAIANLSENQVIREGLFDLTGTADDPDPYDKVAYRLDLFTADGGHVKNMTLIRTYNSLRTLSSSSSPSSADFGPGWTYAIHDIQMSIDEKSRERDRSVR